MAERRATRDQIVREATRLFAQQGIKATTVAQIEAAVGLRPGSGGVHRYFATKDDLVRAVLDAQVDWAREVVDAAAVPWPVPPPDQVAEYLAAFGRYALERIDDNREIGLILLRDAHMLPPDVLDEHRRRNFEISYATAAAALRELLPRAAADERLDPDALAFLLMAPLIYFRVIDWATGAHVLGLDDDRLVATWSAVFEPIFTRIAEAVANDESPG
jgi:AcrR family transcriptional regulator